MKIYLGEVALARGIEYGEVPLELKISGEREVQLLSTIRGQNAKAINRGNLVTSIEFRVRQKHNDVEESQQEAIQHASTIDTTPTTLTMITEPGETIYILNNAVVTGIVSNSNGNISEHFYKIVGGNVSEATNV